MTQQQMAERLKSTYPNGVIEVFDLTGTSDHWEVKIQTPEFRGMSRVQMHQAVMAVFAKELQSGEVHALSIQAKGEG